MQFARSVDLTSSFGHDERILILGMGFLGWIFRIGVCLALVGPSEIIVKICGVFAYLLYAVIVHRFVSSAMATRPEAPYIWIVSRLLVFETYVPPILVR